MNGIMGRGSGARGPCPAFPGRELAPEGTPDAGQSLSGPGAARKVSKASPFDANVRGKVEASPYIALFSILANTVTCNKNVLLAEFPTRAAASNVEINSSS